VPKLDTVELKEISCAPSDFAEICYVVALGVCTGCIIVEIYLWSNPRWQTKATLNKVKSV